MVQEMLSTESGEWMLGDELPSLPWHILIYRARTQPLNELHVWRKAGDDSNSRENVFRRYWVDGPTRWCVDFAPEGQSFSRFYTAGARVGTLRFTAPDGLVLLSRVHANFGLADLTDGELARLKGRSRAGTHTRN